MHILFVALLPPYPPLNGHRLRTWAILQALVSEGHEVTIIGFNDPDGPPQSHEALRRLCRRVELYPPPRRATGWATPGRVIAALSSLPHGSWRFASRRVRARVTEEMATGRVDAVLCDGVYNMGNVPEGLAVPVLLNKDDVAAVIMRRYSKTVANRVLGAYARLEAWKLERAERSACARAAVVLASSQVDREVLSSLCPSAHIAVVPNVVDTERYIPVAEGSRPVVLFQGSLDWPPNMDGVEFFASNIWPELHRTTPEATFRIAGRTSEAVRRRLAGVPCIEFSGHVEDMRDEIAKARVCVVPLRIASGTRLKILEAAAMGKPVVATGVGAEGLRFRRGEEIVVTDDTASFAIEVGALLADGGRRRRLGAAARRRVESDYCLPVARTALRHALEEGGGCFSSIS